MGRLPWHENWNFSNISELESEAVPMLKCKTTQLSVYFTIGETRNVRSNQETSSDETALRDEIFRLKRQVTVLRRTNEQNLVKFRKYEDEAKRKDREIEQLMDPRKNAEVTKVLSAKGAAILMTLRDQNNALIQMVLNKDVQIRRLVAEMKVSKLYASTRGKASRKEEMARLKSLLAKCEEKVKENAEREKRGGRPGCENGASFLEFSCSSAESSPRDSEEMRSVIRSLEAHLKCSDELLSKKDQEISLLTEELNFLKKLLHYKIPKKSFDAPPSAFRKYSLDDAHPPSETRVSDILPTPSTISATGLLQLFHESPHLNNKILSSSAPMSSTRLPESRESMSNSNIIGSENWKDSKAEVGKVIKTDATLLHEIAVGEEEENAKEANNTSKLEKAEKVRKRKRILTKRREPKKRIPKKFGKKKFYEKEKKSRNVLALVGSESKKKVDAQIMSEILKIMDSKEGKTQIFLDTGNSDDLRSSLSETEGSRNLNTKADKEAEATSSNSDKNLQERDSVGGGSSEVVGINSATKVVNCRVSDEEANSINFRREIYRESFDSSFESENGYSNKQQVQQVQVEVQIDSILVQDDSDELENSIGENSHQSEFAETTKCDNCAPDDSGNDNDDDNDVIIR